MSFKDLKKQSSLGNLTEKLIQAVEKSESSKDERFWKPQVDKAGNGYAVIRFLPAPNGEDMPFVKRYNHYFKGPGGTYFENSLTSINQKDPVSDANRTLVNEHGGDYRSCPQHVRDTVSNRKRKTSYYSNIYVVKDTTNPENEGKVFLYKYGTKIFEKIMAAMQPQYEDETPINPFDFWEGANFKLKIKKVAGYWNYDDSAFVLQNPLLDDDDAMEAIWNKEYSLAEIIGPDQFKSYDELKKQFDRVVGNEAVSPNTPVSTPAPVVENQVDWQTEVENSFNSPDIMTSSSDDDQIDPQLAKFQEMINDI